MLTKNKKNPPTAPVIVFGVVEHPKGTFTPTRFELEAGEVTKEVQVAPAGPYKSVAYQYLASRLMEFYVKP